MTLTYVIRTDADKALPQDAVGLLKCEEGPWDVVITHHTESRSRAQNALAWRWYAHAEKAGHPDARAISKLHLGVPILRRDDSLFRERYDAVMRPLSYETKLACMVEPFDFPVTRLMRIPQMDEFLDAMIAHWAKQGVALPLPIETQAHGS